MSAGTAGPSGPRVVRVSSEVAEQLQRVQKEQRALERRLERCQAEHRVAADRETEARQTAKVVRALPGTTPVWAGIGKAFLLTPRDELLRQMDQTAGQSGRERVELGRLITAQAAAIASHQEQVEELIRGGT